VCGECHPRLGCPPRQASGVSLPRAAVAPTRVIRPRSRAQFKLLAGVASGGRAVGSKEPRTGRLARPALPRGAIVDHGRTTTRGVFATQDRLRRPRPWPPRLRAQFEPLVAGGVWSRVSSGSIRRESRPDRAFCDGCATFVHERAMASEAPECTSQVRRTATRGRPSHTVAHTVVLYNACRCKGAL